MEKKTITLVMILFFFCKIFSGDNNEVCFLYLLKGRLAVLRGEGWEDLKKGDLIKQDETLKTFAGSVSKIKFIDNDGVFTIKGGSEAKVAYYEGDESSEHILTLSYGEVIASSFHNSTRIECLDGTITFKEGECFVVLKNDTTKIVAVSGIIKIENSVGDMFLSKGETGMMIQDETPYKIDSENEGFNEKSENFKGDLIEVEMVDEEGDTSFLELVIE